MRAALWPRINLQIEVDKLEPILARLKDSGIALFRPVEEAWYRAGDAYGGNRQFLVQDPDGYLLCIFEDLGRRAAPTSGRIVGYCKNGLRGRHPCTSSTA